MTLEKIVEELHELILPYRVCLCAEPVEGRFIENRFTHECSVCSGVIQLRWADDNHEGKVE